MRAKQRIVAAAGGWLALACGAFAGDANPMRLLRAKLAIERARVMGSHGLYARAVATLGAVAKNFPQLAAQAKPLANTLARRVQAEKPSTMPEPYLKALELSKKTGRPMMLFLGHPGSTLSDATKENLASAKLAPYLRRVIELQVGADDRVAAPLLRRFGEGKAMREPPVIFYVSPIEELLDYSAGGQDVPQLEAKLRGVLARTSAALGPAKLARLNRALAEADALMDAGRCGEARKAYQALAALDVSCAAVRDAKRNITVIDEVADTLFRVLRQAAETKNYGACVPGLLLLQRDFEGTAAAKSAAAALEQIAADPKGKHAIGQVAALLDKDTEPLAPRPAPKPPAGPDTARASSMLRMAGNFLRNKRPDLAKKHLERLIKQYPGTDAAKEARTLLERLR